MCDYLSMLLSVWAIYKEKVRGGEWWL